MAALLALIPSRAYEYGAIIIVLSLAFGGYTLHERHIQHDKDVAAAAALVKKDNAKVAEINSTAQTTEAQSALIYKQVVSVPAVADIGVVCQRAAGSVSLPAADTIQTTGSGKAAVDRGIGPAFDPTGPALTRARDADAQIAYLQRRIAELEKQMNDSP
jgi:hypothetical protein